MATPFGAFGSEKCHGDVNGRNVSTASGVRPESQPHSAVLQGKFWLPLTIVLLNWALKCSIYLESCPIRPNCIHYVLKQGIETLVSFKLNKCLKIIALCFRFLYLQWVFAVFLGVTMVIVCVQNRILLPRKVSFWNKCEDWPNLVTVIFSSLHSCLHLE